MSHSCQSNLQHEHSIQSGAMILIAQRTIEPGEELTIRYIDTVQGKYGSFCSTIVDEIDTIELAPKVWSLDVCSSTNWIVHKKENAPYNAERHTIDLMVW